MEFLLTPKLAAQAIYVVGLALAVGYVVSMAGRSRNARIVLILLGLWLVMVANSFVYDVTHPNEVQSGPTFLRDPVVTFVLMVCQTGMEFGLALVIYRIGCRAFQVEGRVVQAVAFGLVVWTCVVYALGWNDAGFLVSQTRHLIKATIAVNLWLIVVALRNLHHLRRTGSDDPRPRGLTWMGLLAAMFLLVYAAVDTNAVIIVPLSSELQGILPALATVMVTAVLLLGMLLFGEARQSLDFKLVGFLLVAYVSVTSIIIPITRTEVSLRRDFMGSEPLPNLTFFPDSTGGYRVEFAGERWVEARGDEYRIGDDDAELLRPPFPVPFFGSRYDSLWVGTNGSVSFGAEIDADGTYSEGQSFYDRIPSVMPLYTDLAMVAGDARVTVDHQGDELVVTWERLSLFNLSESPVSFQAIFHLDGRIDFNYGEFMTMPLNGFIGVSPGGTAEPTGLSDGLVGAAGSAVFEVWSRQLEFRRWVHPQMIRVTWVGTLGLLVVIVVGLLFYRTGLLDPLRRVLDGLSAVEQGDLEAEVTIHERNELGALADHFNRMTSALREYANRMEDLVARRTEDLDRTITELQSTQAQLVEQEKLASLGSLTAGIAHEIKNPLNFVNNFAEVSAELADELAEAVASGNPAEVEALLADLRENAAQIAKHGKRADSIVRAMMQHARGGTSETETIDVNTFLDEYSSLAWHGMRARDHGVQVDLVRDFGEDVGAIRAMPQELGRVIVNLLNNAFDALRGVEGARVTVSTRRTDEGVKIRIADNGPGIPADIRERIFEPFFTTKATGEGTGLGLSLSYDIVTKGHGGSMSVQESADGGAEFVITLPA